MMMVLMMCLCTQLGIYDYYHIVQSYCLDTGQNLWGLVLGNSKFLDDLPLENVSIHKVRVKLWRLFSSTRLFGHN